MCVCVDYIYIYKMSQNRAFAFDGNSYEGLLVLIVLRAEFPSMKSLT